jgi:hypothetical protein
MINGFLEYLKTERKERITSLQELLLASINCHSSITTLKQEIDYLDLMIDFLEIGNTQEYKSKEMAIEFLESMVKNGETCEDDLGGIIVFDKDENWILMQDDLFCLTWVNSDLIWNKLSKNYSLSDLEIETIIIECFPKITNNGKLKPVPNNQ